MIKAIDESDLHAHIRARMLQRQIASTDAEIDSLAYKLYGLTQEEIAIVEGKD